MLRQHLSLPLKASLKSLGPIRHNDRLLLFCATVPPPLAPGTMGKALNGFQAERSSGKPIMSAVSPASSIHLLPPNSYGTQLYSMFRL